MAGTGTIRRAASLGLSFRRNARVNFSDCWYDGAKPLQANVDALGQDASNAVGVERVTHSCCVVDAAGGARCPQCMFDTDIVTIQPFLLGRADLPRSDGRRIWAVPCGSSGSGAGSRRSAPRSPRRCAPANDHTHTACPVSGRSRSTHGSHSGSRFPFRTLARFRRLAGCLIPRPSAAAPRLVIAGVRVYHGTPGRRSPGSARSRSTGVSRSGRLWWQKPHRPPGLCVVGGTVQLGHR